jgi:acyl dehydratase
MTGPTAKLFGFPRAIAHGLWNKGRALSALGERLPDSGYEVEVRFQKPVLLPGDVRLLASAPAPEGQFVLRGRKDLPHMSGVWRPIVTTTPM